MFENDGCTMWVPGWFGQHWEACCNAHDEAFATGTTWQDFVNANAALYRCVEMFSPAAAVLMFVAVSTAGALFFFRGKKKPKA